MQTHPATPNITLANGRVVTHTRKPNGSQDARMADGKGMSAAECGEYDDARLIMDHAPSCQARRGHERGKRASSYTTVLLWASYTTRIFGDRVTITGNFARDESPITGDITPGYRVADFDRSPHKAMKRAIEQRVTASGAAMEDFKDQTNKAVNLMRIV